MADSETPQNDRDEEPGDAPTADATTDATSEGGRAGEGGTPAYDTGQEGYEGISSGALDSIEDVRAARDFAEMIVDTVREGLLVLDFDLRVVAANESFYDQFEVRPDEAVGRLVYELGNGEWDIPELREFLEDILPEEKTFSDFEVDHDFEGLGQRQMLLNARRLDDHEMILLAIEDVTERRKSERELRDVNEKLKERTRQVRELALALALAEQEERQRIAYVLHEDLQQVLFGANMAAHSGDAERLGAVLSEAMELTRTLSHSLSPPFLEGEGLEDLFRWLAGVTGQEFGLDVAVEVGDGVPVPDEALRVLLYQVVRGLLFNVAKHAGTEHVRIVVGWTDGHVRVTVEDEGAGFDPASLGEAGASGLGLRRARERLELIGGRLEVASEPGEGTRITMEFPLQSE